LGAVAEDPEDGGGAKRWPDGASSSADARHCIVRQPSVNAAASTANCAQTPAIDKSGIAAPSGKSVLGRLAG